ncbi:sugar transporter [Kordiimonas lipolytica]|uniref:Sugar transporter n=1 Tax=Kordiimonas lipolytica TaxID=1662421 RepID=A0ABV8U8P8_9PROT|nr:hypothetical protein [Kordiimonas lipolytica]
MKQILEKLRGAVSRRLDQRKDLVTQQQGKLSVAYTDVRSATVNFGSYRWVLVITFLAAVYYGLFASDRYITEAQLYVKSTKNGAGALTQLSLLAGGGSEARDALLLKSYIHSSDMMRYLNSEIALKDHFIDSQWDMIARLGSEPTEEEFLSYYRGKVHVSIDPESGILTVSGEAFSPEYSQRMVGAILTESERFINSVSQKIATEEIKFVSSELENARDRVNEARDRMLTFQNENQLLDPAASGAALQSVVNELERRLVELETEKKVLSSYLNSSAPQLVSVQSRIDSVQAQLDEERKKIANQDTDAINDVNARFEQMKLEFEFATKLYQVALQGLEQARVDSYHKLKHLVVLQAPKLPDEALAPRKLYNLITLFVLLSLAYGIVTMTLATIREHRDV